MNDFIEFMKIGLGLGTGICIGFEILKAVLEVRAAGFGCFIDFLCEKYESEEEE